MSTTQSTTDYMQDGLRQLYHATLHRFSLKTQELVIENFKATPGCGHIGLTYDSRYHMFNIKCDAGEENLCIHTITQLTSNVVERGGRDQAGFPATEKIPEAFVHSDPFADEFDEVGTISIIDSDDDDKTEKGYNSIYSKPGTSQATGPRDLLHELAALNVTEEQNWFPKHSRTNLHTIASPENLDAIGRLTSCDLTLVDDVKIFCKPQTLGANAAVREAIKRLDNVERALIQEPFIDHLIRTNEDTPNYQLTIERLENFDDNTYGRTFAPPSWWPEEGTHGTRWLSRAGVLRLHKYSDVRQDYYPWNQPTRTRPAISADQLKDPFQPIVLRSFEATALPEDDTAMPQLGQSLQSIEGWLQNTKTPSMSSSSSSGRLLTMSQPSRITASTGDAAEQASSSQSTRPSLTKSPDTSSQVIGRTIISAPLSGTTSISGTAATRPLQNGNPEPTPRMSPHSTPRLDFGKKKKASTEQSNVSGAGPSAKYSSNNAFANLISYDSSDESSASGTTVAAPKVPPGYDMSSSSNENIKKEPSDRQSSNNGSNMINPMNSIAPFTTSSTVSSSKADIASTGSADTEKWSTVTSSKSKNKIPTNKGRNDSNRIIERKAEDDAEPKKKIMRGGRKKAPAPASRGSKGPKGSDALKNLKADFEITPAPKPTASKSPMKPKQASKPAPKCSPRLLTCVKSAFEQARLQRGLVQSRFEIGRVLMHNDVKASDELMEWIDIKEEQLTPSSCFKTFQGAFTPAITTTSRDMCAILLKLGITADPIVSTATWDLTCSTTDRQEVRIMVNALDDTAPTIEAHRRILGATYVHRPQNVHDARWISYCTAYKDIKAVPGAQQLLDSLQTATKQDLEADFSYPQLEGRDRPALSVMAVQLRIASSYALPGASSNHYIEISRIVEPPISRKVQGTIPGSHPFRAPAMAEHKLNEVDTLWYEVSLGLTESPIAFKENESLDVSSEASWTVDQIVDRQYEQDLAILEAATNDLVGRMDDIGLMNKGQARKLEKKRKDRIGRQETEMNRPFTQADYQRW